MPFRKNSDFVASTFKMRELLLAYTSGSSFIASKRVCCTTCDICCSLSERSRNSAILSTVSSGRYIDIYADNHTWLVIRGNGRPNYHRSEHSLHYVIEMKGLRKILRVSWTAKKTNEWVFNKAGVKRELLDTVKVRKLAYYGHTMRKQGNCLEKEIMHARNNARCTQARKTTQGLDRQHQVVDRTLCGRVNQNDSG